MKNNNDGETPKKKKRFKLNLWWKVGLVGLLAGLVGGGVAYEVGSLLTNGHVSSLLSVPSSSSKKVELRLIKVKLRERARQPKHINQLRQP